MCPSSAASARATAPTAALDPPTRHAQLVIGRGHDKGVDYWALGILLYEQVAGYSPFADHEHHDQMAICKSILRGEFEFPAWVKDKEVRGACDSIARTAAAVAARCYYTRPKVRPRTPRRHQRLLPAMRCLLPTNSTAHIVPSQRRSVAPAPVATAPRPHPARASPHAPPLRLAARPAPQLRDIIHRLLQKDVARRLGCLRGGAGDVKAHRFFRPIDFDMLYRKALPAPWKPKLAGTLDTSNFEAYEETDVVEPYSGDAEWDRDF